MPEETKGRPSRGRMAIWLAGIAGVLIVAGVFTPAQGSGPGASTASPAVAAPRNGTLEPVAYLPSVYNSPDTPTPTATATPTLTPTPTVTPTATPTSAGLPVPPADAAWQDQVAYIRSLAGLPGVAENADFSQGCFNHARYMVKTDDANHAEDPTNPWYTPEGNAAAPASVLLVYGDTAFPTRSVFNGWMSGAFHGITLLDPRWQISGYGSYAEAVGDWRFGACMDVQRGLGALPPGAHFPLPWPGDGTVIPILRYNGDEAPDPLTSCPGYTAPSGPPIYLLAGDGSGSPTVTAHSLEVDGQPLESCVFHEASYVHPDPAFQSVGRAILATRDGVILMPRAPLQTGKVYTVSITVDGTPHTWSFRTPAPLSRQQPALSGDLFLP